jgi:16S rRNA pseudouridine516 synthase
MKRHRLDRFLTRLLKRSKKDIRAAIASGSVQVDGVTVRDVSNEYRISTFCTLTLEHKIVYDRTAYYVMLHKPKGYVSATKDTEHPCVVDFFDFDAMPWTEELRLVGRLDRFTTGLLLLTNDSAW